MKRLTKTQIELLAEAAAKPSGLMGAMSWYSTSSHPRRSAPSSDHRSRRRDALQSLVTLGLADAYKVESNYRPTVDGWGTVHATEFSARITDAGRAVLKGVKP